MTEKRRAVTPKDIEDITKMLDAKMDIADIESITGFCDRTIRRIRDGEHVLQKNAIHGTSGIPGKPTISLHNDLLMIYSAISDIRDSMDELLKNRETEE